ncbi:MAG: hypothetical protein WC100_02610 [Sterolibacterium sp.]
MQVDFNFVLQILGSKEVELAQLRQTLDAMTRQIKELQQRVEEQAAAAAKTAEAPKDAP